MKQDREDGALGAAAGRGPVAVPARPNPERRLSLPADLADRSDREPSR